MDSRIEKCVLFISKNFQSKISLSALAKEACLSEYHFHRLFKEATRQTPVEYINRIRLEYAAHYLFVYPEIKSQEVAFECGFSSPATFSRSFSKYYKLSPSQYRKNKSEVVFKEIVKNIHSETILKKSDYSVQYFSYKKVAVKRVSLLDDELNAFF